MISRVAESCFWLYRYIERMDNTARMVDVNHVFILDTQLDRAEAWRPLLLVAGEAPRFLEKFGAEPADGETVQRYLTWDKENPVSIYSSAYWARECARTIRESISREMWECLNRTWLWLDQSAGRRLYERDRSGFYERIKEASQLFRGVCADTVLHEEAYDFMQLGMQIERAGMTARILDVKHERLALLEDKVDDETPRDFAQWHATLRSCSAIEPFLKRGRSFRGSSVVSFLLSDEAFPRAILHCLVQACELIERIRRVRPADSKAGSPIGAQTEIPGGSCSKQLRELADYVEEASRNGGDLALLHEILTHTIDSLASIAENLHQSFFAPSLPASLTANSMSTQSQSS